MTHADDAAVDRFASAMKAKLAAARAKGRGGWEDKDDCTQQELSESLRAHVEKGDPRDVANFCMFLHQRGEGIAQPAIPGDGGSVPLAAGLETGQGLVHTLQDAYLAGVADTAASAAAATDMQWADRPWRAATGWLRSSSGSKIIEVSEDGHIGTIDQITSELIAAAVNAYRRPAAAGVVVDEAIRHAGRMLSNCAFNLAQRTHLTDDERRSLDESRRAWDAALAGQAKAVES